MFKLGLILAVFYGYISAQDYLGCFKNANSNFINLSNLTDRKECLVECKSRYYKYAGLMETQCYCIYILEGLNSDDCSLCDQDNELYCGFNKSISIYNSGQKGPSPPRNFQISQCQSTSLNVTWQPPNLTNGNIISYMITVKPINTYSSHNLETNKFNITDVDSTSINLINLHPGTKYNISLKALNNDGESESVILIDRTKIGPPNKPDEPKILQKIDTEMKINISEGTSQNGPVTAYQIVVVYPSAVAPTDHDISYPDYNKAILDGTQYYVTGEFHASKFYNYKTFIIGNGQKIGGYYNAPLKDEYENPKIGLVVVSKLGNEIQYSYSNLTGNLIFTKSSNGSSSGLDSTTIGLIIAITLSGALLFASILFFFLLKLRHEKILMTKLPEQQELTLQGPMYEVDNMAYIPEDVPERPNYYQDLKTKVWSIPRNFLNIESSILKHGRFGTIHLGTVQNKNGTTSKVIIHSIVDGKLRASEKKHMLRDLDVCIKLTGPNKYLSNLIGNCETSDMLYVVFELASQNLKKRLLAARSSNIFPYEYILPIGSGIASGLVYLEAHKIIHSNLCARSIGLTDDFIPKIMGFGLSKYSLEDVKLARWTAPERFGNKKHIQGVVWAYGVVIWEIMSMGGTPYSDLEDDCDVEEAVVEKNVKLPQLADMTDPIYQVLVSCWQNDPEERPTFDELTRLNTLSICPIAAITEPYLPELELN